MERLCNFVISLKVCRMAFKFNWAIRPCRSSSYEGIVSYLMLPQPVVTYHNT